MVGMHQFFTRALTDLYVVSGWEPRPGQDCMHETYYGLRYMRMLVSCATSVLHLQASKILPLFAAADATIVSLVAPTTTHDVELDYRGVSQEFIDAMERGAPADTAWTKSSSKWVSRRADAAVSGAQETSACHLHSEAGLMAFTCKEQLPPNEARDSGKDTPISLVCISLPPRVGCG